MGLGPHKQENPSTTSVLSAAEVWERRERLGGPLGKWHLS